MILALVNLDADLIWYREPGGHEMASSQNIRMGQGVRAQVAFTVINIDYVNPMVTIALPLHSDHAGRRDEPGEVVNG